MYPRTKDYYETDKHGNFILDQDGNLIGKKYGTKKTRDNIFRVIKVEKDQSEFLGYFYIQACGMSKENEKRIYLSTDREGLNIAKGRFEGIMNGNYKQLNPFNHVTKDVSYLGIPDSEFTHYFRYAYNHEGKIDETLFIHREGIRIGGGKFDMDATLFDELMGSFVGLSKMERFKLAPILIDNLRKFLDNPNYIKVHFENLVDDLNELYEEFPGTGDIRERGLSVLRRELDDQMDAVRKHISVRSASNGRVNNFIVDNFVAQDFVKGTNIEIEDIHDRYFKYSYAGGGDAPVLPFDFLFDYKNNKLYIKNINGMKVNGYWIIKPGETRLFDNLVADKSSKIELKMQLDSNGNRIADDTSIQGILKLLWLPDSKIDKMLDRYRGDLITAFGDFLHIHGLNNYIDELNHKTEDELEILVNYLFKSRPRSSDIRRSAIKLDWTPKGGFTDGNNVRGFRVDHISDVLFLEYRQYMDELKKITDKYEHLDMSKLSADIGKYTNISGQPDCTVNNIKDLVEYFRIQMLRNLLSNPKYDDGSGITTFGYLLAYYKAADYWVNIKNFREIDRFECNSMLRGIHIPLDGETKAISTIIEEGRTTRDLFEGDTSYYDVILGWPDANGGAYLHKKFDITKIFPSFIDDIKKLIDNGSFLQYSNLKRNKILQIGNKFDVKITQDNNQLKKVYPVGQSTGKENTIIFFYRQLLQLGYNFEPIPSSVIDRTYSHYISKVLTEYLGPDDNRSLLP